MTSTRKSTKGQPPLKFETLSKDDATFQKAAEIFRIMSAPMRLRIMSCLCAGEKNVTELLTNVNTTQSNMSQHLSTLYQAGILSKRRDGVQIYYQIANPSFHPPARSARIGNTNRGSYIEDSIHSNKFVPPVGTYETISQDAGSSGRMMRVSKMRRSPSACFPRDERVCCTCAAVGPRDQNVAYDDVRITAYRSWMG